MFREAPDLQSLIKQVKMKILVDVYFDQIGSDGEQVNNTQIFTHLLYSSDSGINTFADHGAEFTSSEPGKPFLSGLLELSDQTIDHDSYLIREKLGSNLYIKAEEIKVTGKLQVEEGYYLFLEGVNCVNVLPTGALGENITARQKKHYNFPAQPEASQQDVDSFCNDQENGYLAKTWAETKKNLEDVGGSEPERSINVKLYPNPARELTTVEIEAEISDKYYIELVDLNGRVFFRENIESSTGYLLFDMDLSVYACGIYLLNIQSSKGVVESKKLIRM